MARKSKKSSQNKRGGGGGGGKRCIPRGPCSIQQRSCSKDLGLDYSGGRFVLRSIGYSAHRFVVSLLNDTLCGVIVLDLFDFACDTLRLVGCFICILLSLLRCLVCFVFNRAQEFFRSRKNDALMKMFEEGMVVLRGPENTLGHAWKNKALRDVFEVVTKWEPSEEEVDEDIQNLCHYMTAALTLRMAECGLVEKEKHSSIAYAEEHADVLFDDGGANFFNMWKEAVGRAAWEQKKREEMERMINDGDTEGQMLILKVMMKTMDKAQNERRTEHGMLFNLNFASKAIATEWYRQIPGWFRQ